MTMQFLSDDNISSSLKKDINFLEKASENFCKYWLNDNKSAAKNISEKALSSMRNIAITILTYRDIQSTQNRFFKKILNIGIGNIIENIPSEIKKIFYLK